MQIKGKFESKRGEDHMVSHFKRAHMGRRREEKGRRRRRKRAKCKELVWKL